METAFTTDYFAPLGRHSRFRELGESAGGVSVAPLRPVAATGLGLEPADPVTYVIMGLATLAAVVVPLLNLN